MTQVIFTTPGYQTWVIPSDWSDNNCFEVIGAGGSGCCALAGGAGGGGGGYARSNNLVGIAPGTTVSIYVAPNTPPNGVSIAGQPGGPTYINVNGAGAPINTAQGVYTTGSAAGYYWTPGTPGAGQVGQVKHSGGYGDPSTAAGGAAGFHGNGLTAASYINGGAGDANYGGAGGISTYGYNPINNGQNGANNGAGGGGAFDLTNYGGWGGLYGGGGGATEPYVIPGNGAQGIAKITWTPHVAAPNTPAITPNTPPPECVPTGFDTATPAQIYWGYGAWTDPWNNVSSAHYDTNYKKLLSLSGDDDTITYDIQYNNVLPWNFINEQENFYLDYPRIWKSRSNEWLEDGGQKSIFMRHRTLIGDADCVPNIDPPSGYCTLLTNLLFMDEQTYGYRLSYSNNFGYFNPGDIVLQQIDGNTVVSGTVYMMDSNYIYVNIPVGGFFADYSVYSGYNVAINAYVTASVEMNEKYSANVFPGQSRYICKSTVLETGMDAEDLQTFMTAYRPANTNFKVYGKVKSASDPDKYSDRIWTRLIESNGTVTSFSSLTNPQDYINVTFDLPVSQLLLSNMEGCSCDVGSLNVTVPSVHQFAAGDYIYISSPGQGTFNVRQIINIPNTDTLAISTYPSFSNTSNLNVGIIPGLEDLTGAFQYDQNSNIVRYVTTNDVAFDMFNQFAVKIVPISDNPVTCPTVTEFRAVAKEAT